MNPEAQRIAIAEACGWTKVRLCDSSEQRPMGPYGLPPGFIHEENEIKLPDYLNDLNAMHEAEKVLSTKQRHIWCSYIDEICGNPLAARSATAAQRAEAFLRTFNEWEESQ